MRPPDIVVRLTTPLNLALDRNTTRKHVGKESDGYIIRRHQEFCPPNFPDARVINLDTSGSRDDTIQTLRRHLWSLL